MPGMEMLLLLGKRPDYKALLKGTTTDEDLVQENIMLIIRAEAVFFAGERTSSSLYELLKLE